MLLSLMSPRLHEHIVHLAWCAVCRPMSSRDGKVLQNVQRKRSIWKTATIPSFEHLSKQKINAKKPSPPYTYGIYDENARVPIDYKQSIKDLQS